MSRSSLIKLQAPISNFIKKGLQDWLFPVKFTKFLRTPCFTEHLQWLLLKVSGFQPASVLKKRLRNRCFAINLAKFLRTSFLSTEHFWMTASCAYLWILRRFSEAGACGCSFVAKLNWKIFLCVKKYMFFRKCTLFVHKMYSTIHFYAENIYATNKI